MSKLSDEQYRLAGEINQNRIHEITKDVCNCGHRHMRPAPPYENNPCSNKTCNCKEFRRGYSDDNYSPKQDG